MDDRHRRSWSVATDKLGPNTAIRPRLTRRGLGGVLAVLGNPVSFTVDPVLGCLPWISLRGGRDAESAAVRQGLLNQDDGSSFFLPAGIDAAAPQANNGGAAAPPASNPNAAGGSGTKGNTGNPKGPTKGPFAYIGAVKT